MHNHVSAQLQRILQVGGRKCVVADDLDVLAICMCDLGNGCDICYLEVGICGSFEVDAAGIGLKVSLNGLKVRGVDEIDLNALAGHAVVEQCEGAAVESAVCDDMLARTGDRPQSRGDSAHAGTGRDAGLAALESGYLAFEHGCGGVAETGVDITCLLTGEAVAALLAAVEHEGRGLENGRGKSAVLSVLNITGMDGFSAKAEAIVIHLVSS